MSESALRPQKGTDQRGREGEGGDRRQGVESRVCVCLRTCRNKLASRSTQRSAAQRDVMGQRWDGRTDQPTDRRRTAGGVDECVCERVDVSAMGELF